MNFFEKILEMAKSMGVKNFAYYKKWAMSILDKQKEEPEEDGPNEETIVKALAYTEMIAKAGYPVGTIREWKGKKYIKVAPNQWKPKYDKINRGAKMSLSHLKKAVANCNSEEELYNLINTNASRFRDENGHPLPEVQELHDIVSKRQAEMNNTGDNGGNAGESAGNGESAEVNGSEEKKEDKKKTSYAEKIAAIQKLGKKTDNAIETTGSSGRVDKVAENVADDTVNAVKTAVANKEKNKKNSSEMPNEKPENEMTDEEKENFLKQFEGKEKTEEPENKEMPSAKNFTKLQLNQAYNLIGMKGNKSLDQLKTELEKHPDIQRNKAALMLIDKMGPNGDNQANMDKIYDAIQNGTLDSLGNNSKEKPEEETFESLTEKYNATKDPDEREKILNKIMSLEKEKNDTINDMKEETYEDMGYSEKPKEEIDNMDRAEFFEYMSREQKSIPMDKIGRGGGRITNFDNAYNVCKKIAETYGVSDEGVKKLQDFMTYNTDTASRLHDELNEKMGMSYELLDADYDMAYKNALKQLLGKKTNGDSDKEKAAIDKYHGTLGAAARKYL